MLGQPHVVAESHQARLVLTLVNPDRRNAVSMSMWRELARISREISGRTDIRAVVVRGSGAVFSAGADITDFGSARAGSSVSVSYDDLVEDTCRSIEAIAQPTLALIRGPCMGAGASLAAACDMRIAEPGSFFAVPAGRLGLGYDPRGISRFRRVFGDSLTRALLFTAQRVGVERAAQAGVVHTVADDCDEAAAQLLASIEANAPLTLRAAKLAIRAQQFDADPALARLAEDARTMADASRDYAEGRAAFTAGRRPVFEGQ